MGLSKQIALPHEYSPERFPSFPALERTAVMGFNVPTTLALPANTPIKVMLSRQATYPAWAEQTFSGAAYQSNFIFDQVAAPTGTTTQFAATGPTLSGWKVANTPAGTYSVGMTGVTNSFSPYPVLGLDQGTGYVPWTWIPSNWVSEAVVGTSTPFAAQVTFAVTCEIWSSPGEGFQQFQALGTTAAGNCSTRVSLPATSGSGYWVRPRSIDISVSVASTSVAIGPTLTIFTCAGTATFSGSTSTQGTYNITPVSTTGFMPLVIPAEFANSQLPWYSTRTTAAALLGTNVSQVLNKGGTVLAGRVAPQVVNPFSVPSSYINSLHPAEKAFLPLETGVYTFAPPSTDLAEFWDYTLNTSTGALAAPLYRLDNTSLVNVMFLTATAVAEQLAVNVDWHVEFRTSSALFQIGLSPVTLETLHQAQIALATVGFFFENPEHKKILSAVIAAAKKYGPAALGVVNPTAGKVAAGAVKILSSKPKNQMKSTSAAASGMTPKQPKPKAPKKKGAGKKKK